MGRFLKNNYLDIFLISLKFEFVLDMKLILDMCIYTYFQYLLILIWKCENSLILNHTLI